MIELAPYFVIVVLVIVIYCLGEQRGKDKAEKKQAIDTLKVKEKYDDIVDQRMSRFEKKQEAFEKHVGGIDYSKLNDAELERLHKGHTLTDFAAGADEVTPANVEPPIGSTDKIQGSD